MNRFQYPAIIALALWTAVAPAAAEGQDVARVRNSSTAPFVVTQPEAAHVFQPSPGWMTSIQLPAGSDTGAVLRLQAPGSPRAERGLGRKVFGAIVGAAGGFFAGGYLGAAIEGDRCHCDDPGLKGALIGMPIGATAGGILGWHYLF